MKKILTVLTIALASTVFAGGEQKKVCHIDEKTKKEVCKMVKVHKKLEGTEVPQKK